MLIQFINKVIITTILFIGFVVNVLAQTPQKIAKLAVNSTVSIHAYDQKSNLISIASGFVIAPGRIATNNHAIENAYEVYITAQNSEKKFKVTQFIGVDKVNDLAIILSDSITGPALSLSDDYTLEVGEKIYAIGNPEGFSGTFSEGNISGIRYLNNKKVIQITAPISNGSSGGPILNEKGEVVGIAYATDAKGQNLNFAIPIEFLIQLKNKSEDINILPPKGNMVEVTKMLYRVVVYSSAENHPVLKIKEKLKITDNLKLYKEGMWFIYAIPQFDSYQAAMKYNLDHNIFGAYVQAYKETVLEEVLGQNLKTVNKPASVKTDNESKTDTVKKLIDTSLHIEIIKQTDPEILPEVSTQQKQNSSLIEKQSDDELKKLDADKQFYENAILNAEVELINRNYKTSRAYFEVASKILPNEVYPKKKIVEIDGLIKVKDLNAQNYQEVIILADKALDAMDYEKAKSLYEKAMELKPENDYLLKIILKIERMMKIQKQHDESYQYYINLADLTFNYKDYHIADEYYKYAHLLKPQEIYPKQKIKEADAKIKEQEDNQKRFELNVKNGDIIKEYKDYINAKKYYLQALDIMPNNEVVQKKIKVIEFMESISGEIKEIDTTYSNTIFRADLALSQKKYKNAESYYKEAINIKNEQYPLIKIREINAIYQEARNAYSKAVVAADNAFTSKEYNNAIVYYIDAQKADTTADYPRNKIAEIMELQKNKKNKQPANEIAKSFIKDADLALVDEKYSFALSKYKLALVNEPDNKYAYDKIHDIEAMLETEKEQFKGYDKQIDKLLKDKYDSKIDAKIIINQDLDVYKRLLLREINKKREVLGIEIISLNTCLSKASYFQADQMAGWEEVFILGKGKVRSTKERIRYFECEFEATEMVFRIPFTDGSGKNTTYRTFTQNLLSKIFESKEFKNCGLNNKYKYIGIGLSLDENDEKAYASIIFGY